eukprot:CAMPEP_0115178022 /NCGR_PEP_ID=MMETSP0270-20121206/5686_1 /TAXON_ID=71861 /ORGANISM="Scrippsiella trochoidea, Strain CCMP3099" /LENGTH=61 /DNA_ID=CAMNT_0002590971 /DNA_START=570 /DNA_END=751 /DNA_ORIENTATION=-
MKICESRKFRINSSSMLALNAASSAGDPNRKSTCATADLSNRRSRAIASAPGRLLNTSLRA